MTSFKQRAFLSLLSDSELRPAAFQLSNISPDLSSLLGNEAFKALLRSLPCLAPGETLEGLAEAEQLKALGVQTITPGQISPLSSVPVERPAGALYFSGEWFLAPLPGPAKNQVASRSMALKLVQLVAAEADNHEIEDVFRREPTLSYHLLRLVNSPAIGNGRRIDSFAQAIMLLGRRQLRRWLNLLLFSAAKNDPRSAMLLAHVTARARTMEQLAHLAGHDKDEQERAFMAGMFSLLGAMFGQPLAEVIEPLKLEKTLNEALLERQGLHGTLLNACEAIERGQTELVEQRLAGLLAAESEIDVLRIEALLWTLTLLKESPND